MPPDYPLGYLHGFLSVATSGTSTCSQKRPSRDSALNEELSGRTDHKRRAPNFVLKGVVTSVFAIHLVHINERRSTGSACARFYVQGGGVSGTHDRSVVEVVRVRLLHGRAIGRPRVSRNGHVERRAVVAVEALRVVGEADELPRRRGYEGQVPAHGQQGAAERSVADLWRVPSTWRSQGFAAQDVEHGWREVCGGKEEGYHGPGHQGVQGRGAGV